MDRAHRVNQCDDDGLAANVLDHARAGEIAVGVVHGVGEAEPADAAAREHTKHEAHELRARGLP